jgi:DNA-binding response OmpR family regulator
MAKQLNIIVVEDHDSLREVTVAALQGEGHHVLGVESGQALDELQKIPTTSTTDLFVLDLNLPDEDGIAIARRIRQHQPEAGIVMVTARGLLAQKVEGYESGADLYITKPASLEELRVAIAALTRRLKRVDAVSDAADSVVITFNQRQLLLSGAAKEVKLGIAEANVLAAMVQAPNQRLENWQLVELLGKSESSYRKSNLQVLIFRLRKKLEQVGAGEHAIKLIWQVGYQLGVEIHLI